MPDSRKLSSLNDMRRTRPSVKFPALRLHHRTSGGEEHAKIEECVGEKRGQGSTNRTPARGEQPVRRNAKQRGHRRRPEQKPPQPQVQRQHCVETEREG